MTWDNRCISLLSNIYCSLRSRCKWYPVITFARILKLWREKFFRGIWAKDIFNCTISNFWWYGLPKISNFSKSYGFMPREIGVWAFKNKKMVCSTNTMFVVKLIKFWIFRFRKVVSQWSRKHNVIKLSQNHFLININFFIGNSLKNFELFPFQSQWFKYTLQKSFWLVKTFCEYFLRDSFASHKRRISSLQLALCMSFSKFFDIGFLINLMDCNPRFAIVWTLSTGLR